ncbi:hypothetical protein AtubIFM55763_008098 [Aspergillus tubingensis]|uniref:Uncharacterized protein n=5 Tax=Aspergillus subgen. Circumdati TaxID=2720871 RepID=A0A1L9MZU9_ASPTC|nr:hypothetical protein BO79DRAFT_289258 [Aspergillus costaricaensis CBS 115574]XP_025559511.1 hypothetical protein BO88DRAFT_407464 [Aspergillus vadensis CBS 113365]XP_035357421.1 uncharacterized protein AtWU_06419 [Aspergillus tubingensis]OJI82550.1 hypothetical protein ASPTUDRAFT_191065 [Aspergillus tubingensis CBS 134.48]GAQ42011.1 hypothetical protein AKAW_02232 [Aspergillus niger]PYH65717.1 hypothetical protein BO88DRAFT_407464 [Aspergillus vadensis CBS 113365]RAK86307.1 hypothetical pr
MEDPRPDYKAIFTQITVNLSNTLTTFGPRSPQYKCVVEMLKEFMRRVEKDMNERNRRELDPDMLSTAMEFLKIGEER